MQFHRNLGYKGHVILNLCNLCGLLRDGRLICWAFVSHAELVHGRLQSGSVWQPRRMLRFYTRGPSQSRFNGTTQQMPRPAIALRVTITTQYQINLNLIHQMYQIQIHPTRHNRHRCRCRRTWAAQQGQRRHRHRLVACLLACLLACLDGNAS